MANLFASGDTPYILNIGFGEGAVTITYAEPREVNDAAGMQRSLAVDIDAIQDEVNDLVEAALRVLDAGAVILRNPPAKVGSARRALMDLEADGTL